MTTEPRLLEVRKNVLKQSDVLARALRDRFRAQNTAVISLVSSPAQARLRF
jgi:hydrogenase nickel incorporation protein HypB